MGRHASRMPTFKILATCTLYRKSLESKLEMNMKGWGLPLPTLLPHPLPSWFFRIMKIETVKLMVYCHLSLKWTPSGPALAVHLREVSAFAIA